MTDYLDSIEFLALLDQYRHAQHWDSVKSMKALEAVKAYIRAQSKPLKEKPNEVD